MAVSSLLEFGVINWFLDAMTNHFFVELKGTDVSHACDQLFATARNASVMPLTKERIGFLIIASKYPRFDTFVRKAKDRAAKEYKAGFHVVNNEGEFDIVRVAAIDGPY